jgi:non-specific serine/threonine protein kinase
MAGGPRHNLPQPLTSFVGREREIAGARRLLDATRLLTLTGTGGVGKTRLAREIAASLLDPSLRSGQDVRDGVWLVELAALADPALVPRAVAAVLDVREEPARPLTATLTDGLRPKQLLLVLDNCEHLIEACAELADALLRACPELRILTTSRQPLGIAGETTFRVPSLALSLSAGRAETTGSAPGQAEGRGSVSGVQPATGSIGPSAPSEAVRLFVDRARAAMPDFTLTDRNIAAVERICRRLDGIPLAIELAAARVAVLSPGQIAARLGDRFHLLTGGSRTALPRYRALRALIDWSHELLDERERLLLRRLSVFAGGWTLEAAESVCADEDLPEDEILDLLSGLVAKSLVLAGERTDEVRYRFLETLRDYAAERLRDADEEAIFCERHRDWFLTLAERAEPELTGPHQAAWFDRLDRERENLRAAQSWAVARGDPETLVRLGAALWQFWHERADAADARELIDAIVPLVREVPPIPALARALRGVGALAGTLADYATCRVLLDEGLAVARQLEDRRTLATLLDTLGRQSFVQGRYSEARALLNEGLAILRELDDRHGLARALSHLGFLDYLEDRQASAREAYREGIELAREAGDPAVVAEFLDNLGRTFQAEGDLDGAARAYREAVGIWRETGHGHWLAMGLNNLGGVQMLRGELGAARAQLEEALGLSCRMGNRRRMAFTLEAVATLAAMEGQAERAVRLDTVAAAAVAEMGASLTQPAYAAYVPHLTRARQTLGRTAAAAAAATGRAMTLPEAVDETLAWLAEPQCSAHVDAPPAREKQPPPVDVPPVVSAAPTRSGGTGLSRRELEVAALVSRGLTNRQIADELVITEGTAANHVKHILARLVLDSRVQIAAWAVEHGLHQRAAS